MYGWPYFVLMQLFFQIPFEMFCNLIACLVYACENFGVLSLVSNKYTSFLGSIFMTFERSHYLFQSSFFLWYLWFPIFVISFSHSRFVLNIAAIYSRSVSKDSILHVRNWYNPRINLMWNSFYLHFAWFLSFTISLFLVAFVLLVDVLFYTISKMMCFLLEFFLIYSSDSLLAMMARPTKRWSSLSSYLMESGSKVITR